MANVRIIKIDRETSMVSFQAVEHGRSFKAKICPHYVAMMNVGDEFEVKGLDEFHPVPARPVIPFIAELYESEGVE